MQHSPALEPSAFPAEFQFLLTCARPVGDDSSRARQLELIASGLDWPGLLRMATRHRVQPLLYQHLKALPGVPEEIAEGLRRLAVENALKDLMQSAELARLGGLLAAERIDFLLLKGLTTPHHGGFGPALRHAGDTDLWVDPTQTAQAAEVFERAGYRRHSPPAGLTPLQEWAMQRMTNQVQYFLARRKLLLELHWRPFANPYRMPFAFDKAVNDCSDTIEMGGQTIKVLDRLHHIIFICQHGAKHGWMRLKWVFDLPPLLDGLAADDLVRLLERARELNAEACVRETLLMSHLWFKTPVLPEQARGTGGRPQVERSFKLYRRMLCSDEDARSMLLLGFLAGLNAMALDGGARAWTHHWSAKTLGVKDFESYPLPDALFWLYFLIRPFSMIRRRLAGR